MKLRSLLRFRVHATLAIATTAGTFVTGCAPLVSVGMLDLAPPPMAYATTPAMRVASIASAVSVSGLAQP